MNTSAISLPNLFALMDALEIEKQRRQETAVARSRTVSDVKPSGKKMGVWINGKLALQTRDRDACDDLATKAMNDKRNESIWVAPLGSFVAV